MTFIKNFPNRMFAEQARQILDENGINAILKSADVGILGTTTSAIAQGVDLYVEEDQAQRAWDLLHALYDGI
ncbi:MAG: hypothetical protein GF313_15915 [Caldithrix sp.]|nr:hypothetical protein [Caldithrix sp.]